MKIEVAGQDRTDELGGRLRRAAAERPQAAAVSMEAARQADVLSIRDAAGELEQLEKWLAMLRAHNAIRTEAFVIPARPGLAGAFAARVRRFLWKLLRYQHDHIAFQQNAVNIQLTLALEAAMGSLEQQMRALRERLEKLEGRAEGPAHRDGGAS